MKKRMAARVAAMVMVVCLLPQTAMAAGIATSFLKSEDAQDRFVMVSKQTEMLEKFEEGKTMYDMAEYEVASKAQITGTTLVVTTQKSDEYMIFGTSDIFLSALYQSGGRSVRYNSSDISVEFKIAAKSPETNYTRIMVSTLRPRGTMGEAWHISSFSGETNETFTLRLKLPRAYQAEQLKLMTYSSTGRTAQVQASLGVVKIGDNYYAKATGLRSGTYAIVKAS